MSVLIKTILGLEETEQRDGCCARWKGGHAWEWQLPWAPQGTGPTQQESAKCQKNKNKNKQNNKTKETRTVSVTYSISKITCEWSGYLEPTSLIPPSPSEWVHSKAGTFKYWILQN